jgi:hypothetical protein
MLPEALLDRIFQTSPHVRYAAVRVGMALVCRHRPGFEPVSAGESDRAEELLVNPALVTLASQRGALDGVGARYLLVRYGDGFRFIRATGDGHVSVAIDPQANVVGLAGQLDALIQDQAG